MRINLPKDAKTQKVWMKKLGITDVRVAKMAVCRDNAAALAVKRIKARNYSGALTAVAVADRMQGVIESTQSMFKGLKF